MKKVNMNFSNEQFRAQFAERLTALQKRAGLSGGELANLAGVQQSSLSLYKSAARLPDLFVAARLAAALNISISDLIGKEERATIEPEHAAAAGAECYAYCLEHEIKLSPDDFGRIIGIVSAALVRAGNIDFYELDQIFRIFLRNQPPRGGLSGAKPPQTPDRTKN